MKNLITTVAEVIATLILGGLPKTVAEDIVLVFSLSDLYKYVESNDTLSLTMCRNVGEKRAAKIIELLKGRIDPQAEVIPEDLEDPFQFNELAMHDVPEMTLVLENGKAKLSPSKYAFGKQLQKNGNPIRNIAKKRFGPALQKLQDIEGKADGIVFTTVSEIQPDYKDQLKELELRSHWHQVTHHGIKMPDGEIWVPGMMGTNARMKNQIHWIRLRSKQALRTWMLCGANFDGKKVNVAKTEAYIGLLLPYTKELLDGFIKPSMETLVDEWQHDHEGESMVIAADGTMTRAMKYTVPEFDGMCIIDIPDELIEKMNLTRKERRRLKKLIAKFKGGTLRAPWHKGIIIVGFYLHDILKEMGVTEFNGRNIDEIAVWCDKSVFKAALGDDGLYAKFEDYVESFEELGHRFGVLLENHGIKETFLPAQQLQAAHGCDPKFVEEGAKQEVEYLKGVLDPKEAARRYEPNAIAKIAQDDPSIMTTWFALEMARNGYAKEYKSSLSGRTHGVSRTGFVVKDLIAFAQWIAYKAGVRKELPTGCLGKYEVYAPAAYIDTDNGKEQLTGKAVASRNPVIANYGLPVVNVVENLGEYEKYFDEDFPYIMVGIHDDLCKLLRMDHDGDKMRLTFDEWFINAVESINKTKVFAEWSNFGAVDKVEFNDETEKEFFESCTVSGALGLNVDACGKMIANGQFTKEEHEWLADYMMNKGTDVKQGADGQNVGGAAGEIWGAMKKANKENKMSKAMAYGKLMKGREVKKEDVMDEISRSNLDIVHAEVRANAPTTIQYTGWFDVHKVMYGNTKSVDGLVGSHFNQETKEWENNLFDTQVSRNKAMWEQMDESAKTVGYDEYIALQRRIVMEEYKLFAEENGVTMADIYDTITAYIFEALRKKWNTKPNGDAEKEKLERMRSWLIVLARTYIQWFGPTMVEVYETNTDMGFLPAVNQPVELDEDIFA